MQNNQIVRYTFSGYKGLYADEKGQFYYKDKPVKKVYNNGSISVLVGTTKIGLIKLRKLAVKSTDNAPF